MINTTNRYRKTIIILGILNLISVIFVLLIFRSSTNVPAKLAKAVPTKSLRIKPNQAVLAELEKRLVLPQGKALIFNLSDLTGLTDQPFFAKARPTDKLILFQHEKKAVIYNPISQKIVNIGPLLIIPATQEAKITDVNNLPYAQSASNSAE